ncbi:MAG: substrate-binding domain-containing protein [Eubacteriales bacterium]|nr:substrate-binding domain-containing protein [Eubacteriales bacterium]
MKKSTRTMFLILSVCMVLLSCIWIYFQRSLDIIELSDSGNGTAYKKHYVLIPDEENSLLWEAVYESARNAAAEADAYLELISPSENTNYTQADCLQIGIASKVDGIILKPDGSETVRALIDQAVEDGIPVITVLEDDSDSQRISFVGLNNYQMGDTYASQVLELLNPDTTDVMILLSSESRSPGTNLVYSQIVRAIEQKKSDSQTVHVSPYSIDSSTDFDTEEAIRDIFLNSETLPDIILCMDEVATECTYQALLDYNEVGNVNIIGFYYSDLILDALQKGTIPVTIALNTEEIGQYSIAALEEYLSLGHASSYYSVAIDILTQKNAASFAEQKETPEEPS